MKDVGIEIRIDQHADSEFATILGNGDYDISFQWLLGLADATRVPAVLLPENNEGITARKSMPSSTP